MADRLQPVVPLAVKGVLIFLILAVFSWGLQVKLSHYTTRGSSSAHTATKLLTEKPSEHLANFHQDEGESVPVEKVELSWSMKLKGIPATFQMFYQVRLSLCSPCRYDLHGPNLMHLPPPALS